MMKKLSGIIFFLTISLVLISTIYGESGYKLFESITKKGEMSEITLAYARRQNYIIRRGEIQEIYPDGIVFYFTIYGLRDDFKTGAFVETRDFEVNGISYLEITRENNINDIEPMTVIYDGTTFQHDEYFEKIKIEEGIVFIEKIIICGSALPNNGVINVDLRFGFDKQIEDFNFQFNLEDIQ